MNGLDNVRTILNAEGETGEPGTFDLVLGNPPYYSDFRIAEIFLDAARWALKPGGTVLIVSKAAEWYVGNMPERFETFHRHVHKLYSVFEATTARR
jgi:16S rRNA (guanine1207-N2)-methyltransferase